jgi:pSer/pThr/pTyr-binding forkhead associated (FHA) protein
VADPGRVPARLPADGATTMSLADARVVGRPSRTAGTPSSPTRSTPTSTRRTVAGASRPAAWPRRGPSSEAVAALLVTEASGAERVVTVDGSPLTIGREHGCALRIDSPYVSRQHARIEPSAAGPTLLDLDSHNGSALNGTRQHEPALLRVGDVIALGDARITCLGESHRQPVTQKLPAPTDDPLDRTPDDRLHLDAATRKIRLGERGPSRRLSAQEFALLHYLYERADRTCQRAELGDAVWGADNWDTIMLYRLVARLRGKIEPDPAQPRYLQSVQLIGYRLVR